MLEKARVQYIHLKQAGLLGGCHPPTHRGCDPPAAHSCDFETPLLDLLGRQLDLEVQLAVPSPNDNMTALLGKVRNTGVKLEIAIILESLCQADELR